MALRMEGKVALVTGGAQGIGRAICDRFAAEGAVVAVLDIKAENAERAAQAIRDNGGQAVACVGNVAERATFESAAATLERLYGRLDVLVNNAIWVRYGPIDAISPETLDRMVGTGFNSVVWGTQVAATLMAKNGGGSIINIASAAGFLGMPNGLIYCGVKAGVLGLTRAAAVELGPKKIRVNAIAPGTIMTEGVSINVDEAGMAKRIARTPVGRLGQVEDIANAAVFLAGDDSGFMTGESMLIDGGVTHAFL
ncbi:SDR family oxidoreductase [Variovorax sp. J22G21]|uniref:SDR family NAD(P)-dependent oxidoreductase n=1 Tax=Variovorax fucosicus TaxID=3053517 RepID=UPI002574C075|nr:MULTISPECIES: SDR family oxidoreductase [unclassified Variovorax]MDM0041347.1 SDR family oxidoreductase [Variovorax sp. J22R193]MDM0057711.1 SDR family oxidoreductase [Variovorax sp. J22G47]MDM0060404.1 SDR family oxidoreductase [Variovorax sp. J22G21]